MGAEPVVLIVEDDRQTNRLLGEIFAGRSCRIVSAKTGPDGIRLARAEAALRRAGVPRAVRTVHETADLMLDESEHRATAGGRELTLTNTEFDLLTALMRAPRLVLSKPQLYARVWGESAGCDERIVSTHISDLRRKIRERCGADPIRTVWGIGYTLRPA